MFFPAAKKFRYSFYLVIAAMITILSSCSLGTIVKKYPKKPFVYDSPIDLKMEGKYSAEDKKTLESQLEQQKHDSIRSRKKRVLFWYTLKKPPVYDSLNAGKSKLYMNALLNSLGYYRDSISFSDTIIHHSDQQRVIVTFRVIAGKQVKLDSVWYNLLDSIHYTADIDTLQKITETEPEKRLLNKGDPFSKPLISAELDRLTEVYRDNGYLRFSKDQLVAVWDTVGQALLRIPADLTEQLQQLEAIRARREKPVADVEIRLKANADTTKFMRYYIGNVKIYPDFGIDTAFYEPHIDTLTRNRYEFISYAGLFKPRSLVRFIYFKRGDLYRQSNYIKTQSKFSSIPAWQFANINQIPRPGTDTVDIEIRLTPAKKFNTAIIGDASKNQGNNLAEGNLLGFGLTYTLLNRNFLKAANQSQLSLRYGIELGNKISDIQTLLFNIGYSIEFPRIIPKGLFKRVENPKSFLSFNAGSTDRTSYYFLETVNASLGWEFNKKKSLIGIHFPNIEYNLLRKRAKLNQLIIDNPTFKYIFNDGLITSIIGNLTRAGGDQHLTKLLRLSGELSYLPGRSVFLDKNLYRFAKVDFEWTHTYRLIRRWSFAWRTFAGVGAEFGSNHNQNNRYLPFFRQYYAGGPNSMRAWSVRRLGPGSTVKSFITDPDRFGDMRLEGNLELRYYITQLFGFPVEGASFMDMGNVWFLRSNPDFVNGEFKFSRLGKDLAVGIGEGFRIDFGFLKARFDFAYKAKDPSPEDPSIQNKWFYQFHSRFKTIIKDAQFQLGINYPF